MKNDVKPNSEKPTATLTNPVPEFLEPRAIRAKQRWRALESKMTESGMTPADVARLAGRPNANALYNLKHGRSSSLSTSTLEKIARIFVNTSVHDLLGIGQAPDSAASQSASKRFPGAFPVLMYELAAGEWREAPALQSDHRTSIPIPRELPPKAFCALVKGPGMELLYPRGTLVFCLPTSEVPLRAMGDVTVLVHREIGHRHEVTLQQLVRRDDRVWLWPRSSEPDYQLPREMDPSVKARKTRGPDGSVEQVRVLGVVIASWQQGLSFSN